MPLSMYRPPIRLRALFSLVTFAAVSASVIAQETTQLPGMTVTGEAQEPLRFNIDPAETSVSRPTTAELLKRTPGGNVNFNGPLSGIVQYRGMFGTRMNTRIDAMPIASGGPNWMDPPLHYAPMPLLDSLEVHRGIAPVSAGSESIGGYVQARRKTSRFSAGDAFEFHGDLSLNGQTVDDGYGLGALLAGSNDTHRAHILGVKEQGDDTEYSGGEIHPTEYERHAWGLGYGFRGEGHEIGIDYLRNETGDAGTPALPMDIVFFDTDILSGDYKGAFGNTLLEGKLYHTEVEHEMTNFHLRQPPPTPARYRNSLADSEATGFDLKGLTPMGDGELGLGVDGHFSEHNADILNPNNPAFFVNNFNDVQRDRMGLFGEWKAPLADLWSYELGARYTRVKADAGEVDGTPAANPGGPQVLRDRFNAADRSRTYDNVDLVAQLFYQVSDDLRFDLGLGRKTRAPSYQELYLWLPLEATAGMADRKRYVGDVNLEPETANEIDLGLDWRSDGLYATPRLFYKRVKDYIQGVPATDPVVIAVSTANGDPNPLQFANVDAELYGFDTDFGARFSDHWRLDGLISYVRGKRRDIDDNLYRIAPLNGLLALTYEHVRWAVTAETVLADDQNRVSVTNQEDATDGYALLNLYGNYRLQKDLLFTAGVNNIFDEEYRDHLNGYNRVRNSDVPFGERLPGPGRSLFARVNYNW